MDQELSEQVENSMREITEKRNQRNITTENWIKHILTLLAGLLSILIAFKSEKEFSCLDHILFSCTLIAIGLSVLSGIVYLYHTIDLLDQNIKFYLESLSKRMDGDNSMHKTVIVPKKIYVFFQYLFYVSSLASLLLLIAYGIMKG